jgi:hypothetical protein
MAKIIEEDGIRFSNPDSLEAQIREYVKVKATLDQMESRSRELREALFAKLDEEGFEDDKGTSLSSSTPLLTTLSASRSNAASPVSLTKKSPKKSLRNVALGTSSTRPSASSTRTPSWLSYTREMSPKKKSIRCSRPRLFGHLPQRRSKWKVYVAMRTSSKHLPG